MRNPHAKTWKVFLINYKFRSKNLKLTFGKPFKIGDLSLEEANDKLYHDIEKLMKNNLKNKKRA